MRPWLRSQKEELVKFNRPIARASVALSAVVVVLASAVAAVPQASAAPGVPRFAAEDRTMAEQIPYMELDEQVRQIASAQANSPLAGSRVDVAGRTLHVYWAGSVPDDLESIQDSAAKRGISVKVSPAAFSAQTLMAAANDLGKVAGSTGAELSVVLHNDGSGLTLRQDALSATAKGQAQVLDAVATIKSRSGIPITLAERGPRLTFADRHNDGSPYYGGATTVSTSGSCTDGFSMYATGAPARFMMTAAHCTDFLDGRQVTNGIGVRMGDSDFIHELFDVGPWYDLGVIRLDANKTNAPYVYSTGGNPMLVKGLASGIPQGGNYCVSATHSFNCNLISGQQVLECPSGTPFGRCIYLIQFTSRTGATVVCSGDSGGPIYYWTSAGIIASGIVSGGYGTTNCATSGAMSVVSSAVNRIPGLALVTG
jgi:hypothetical protein